MTDKRMVIAWRHYCQRQYAQAETICRDILRDQPDDFGSWRLLGEVCLVQEKYEYSLAAYREAEKRSQLSADDLNNLGVALMALGQPGPAEAAYRQSLALRPEASRAFCNLGVALDEQGKREEAASCYRRAIELDGDELRAYHGLTFALIYLGRARELVDFLSGLKAEHAAPAEARYALGLGYAALLDWDEAIREYRQALALRPEFAEAFCDLGCALVELGRFDEGLETLRRAVALNPKKAEFWKNLGGGLTRQAKPEDALGCYEQALELNPDYHECRYDLAATWIRLGDYPRGWEELERRPDAEKLARQLGRPRWDGGPLKGRTILLVAEQGLGDTLQYVRYAPLVKERGGMVIVACQKALLPLLESCPGIDRLVPQNAIPPDYDVFAPLLSLPRIFSTTLQTVPASVPYLNARPELVEFWRNELRRAGRFRVGVAWQGSRDYGHDRLRSFRLSQLEPLARVPGVMLISLQKGPGVEQVAELSGRFPILDLSNRIDGDAGPFMDTAAIMKSLDLVIGCDSSLVHLAGALGVSIWVAHTFVCDSRWMLGRDDSPWYPTARLFRQTSPGDWEGVFSRMAEALVEKFSARPTVARVAIEVAPAELLDKIGILEIKCERITDLAKLKNVHDELAMLAKVRDQTIPFVDELAPLIMELKAVNLAIWQVEDELRECEKRRDFGRRFIELARSVYRNNDRRAAIKRKINEQLGSAILEEKSYAAYGQTRHHAA
jgi:tetratricopeptide (TPR) repeat protein